MDKITKEFEIIDDTKQKKVDILDTLACIDKFCIESRIYEPEDGLVCEFLKRFTIKDIIDELI